MGGPRSAIRLSRAYWLTLALFLALQIADIRHDQSRAEDPGHLGSQAADGGAQAKLDAARWLPKLAVAAYLCVAATFLRRRWPIVFAVSLSGLCVLGNISRF